MANIVELRDSGNVKSYPVTKAEAVYMGDGNTVENEVSVLKDVLSQITTDVDLSDKFSKGSIADNVEVGNTVSTTPTVSDAWRCCVCECKKGDAFTISGVGGANALLWCFTDEDSKLLSKSTSNLSADDLQVFAPDDGFIICNFNNSYDKTLIQSSVQIKDDVDYLNEQLFQAVDLTDSLELGNIATNINAGLTVDTTVTLDRSWLHTIIKCKRNDEFIITGNGGSSALLWCFTDSDYVLYEKSSASAIYSEQSVFAPVDGYLICNFNANGKTYRIVKNAVTIDAISSDGYEKLNYWLVGTIQKGDTVADVFEGIANTNTQWVHQAVHVRINDVLKITCTGGSSAFAYTLTDSQYYVYEESASNAVLTDKLVVARRDGYFFCNALKTKEYSLYKLAAANTNGQQVIPRAIVPNDFPVVSSVTYNSGTKLTYAEIISGYDSLLTTYPDNITKTTLGKDASNTYDIFRYDFYPTVPYSDRDVGPSGKIFDINDYPIAFIEACIHGNEHPCARALLNFMTKVCGSTTNDTFGWLQDNIHFVIIPVANPWGYENTTRGNYNGVDLNRNFNMYWGMGSSDQTDGRYRGTAPLSEIEAQYIASILTEIAQKQSIFADFHTHGIFTDYRSMTCWAFSNVIDPNTQESAGYEVVHAITRSGHTNHELSLESGLIGRLQPGARDGDVSNYSTLLGVPGVSPEVMYRYYDGQTTADYSTNINCMNTEYVTYAILAMMKMHLYKR